MTRRFSIAISLTVGPLLTSCGSIETTDPATVSATRQDKIESLYQEYRPSFPDVNEITPEGVLDLQASEPTVLVDVRTSEEQAVSMLPGAITQDAFEAARAVYAGQTVVTYCTIGARSGEYAEGLRQEGVEVFNLKGSILSWTQAGLPLVDKSGEETKRVHTYGRRWNLVGEGYEATW
jgi:rhodanese-related sulfurtransferase